MIAALKYLKYWTVKRVSLLSSASKARTRDWELQAKDKYSVENKLKATDIGRKLEDCSALSMESGVLIWDVCMVEGKDDLKASVTVEPPILLVMQLGRERGTLSHLAAIIFPFAYFVCGLSTESKTEKKILQAGVWSLEHSLEHSARRHCDWRCWGRMPLPLRCLE